MSRFTTLLVAAVSALVLGAAPAPAPVASPAGDAPTVSSAGVSARTPGGGNWCC